MFIGYGIGDYSFRAVGSALALALIGTAILCFAPGVRGVRPSRFLARAPRGPCQKPLVFPLIAISQEFSDFFNDPKRERLANRLLATCPFFGGHLRLQSGSNIAVGGRRNKSGESCPISIRSCVTVPSTSCPRGSTEIKVCRAIMPSGRHLVRDTSSQSVPC
jgi:hypothetical protein